MESNNIVTAIKKIVGLDNYEVGELVSEIVSDATPVINSILRHIKMKRLMERLSMLETTINEINNRINSEVNQETVNRVQNFAFPIFLQKLLEEDEDQKIKYLVNSIHTIINKQTLNESHLVLIFDILDELRCIEIEYLISLVEEKPFLENETISRNIVKFIEIKLERMGLIEMADSVKFTPAPKKETISMVYSDKTKITELGREFISFIR
ncbi:hypothetical protein [Providencia sp. NPDC089923]|uniref:hypothetical protein n=1 Tax=Providencia sp. NPDC089923 TaxID=3415004 RepID=UPI003C2EADF4